MSCAEKDIAIIGGGVTGAALARLLSAYKLDVVLLEKEADVCFGVSKANSGIVHAGFAGLIAKAEHQLGAVAYGKPKRIQRGWVAAKRLFGNTVLPVKALLQGVNNTLAHLGLPCQAVVTRGVCVR